MGVSAWFLSIYASKIESSARSNARKSEKQARMESRRSAIEQRRLAAKAKIAKLGLTGCSTQPRHYGSAIYRYSNSIQNFTLSFWKAGIPKYRYCLAIYQIPAIAVPIPGTGYPVLGIPRYPGYHVPVYSYSLILYKESMLSHPDQTHHHS